eukprot:1628914-Rhodomonas_salina.1
MHCQPAPPPSSRTPHLLRSAAQPCTCVSARLQSSPLRRQRPRILARDTCTGPSARDGGGGEARGVVATVGVEEGVEAVEELPDGHKVDELDDALRGDARVLEERDEGGGDCGRTGRDGAGEEEPAGGVGAEGAERG